MSLTTRRQRDRQLDLLRSKIALAMGPSEHNMAYHEVRYVRPGALHEPWSTDMSGPYKYAVLDNSKFKLYEVADEQLAVDITRGYRPIDAGENIKLYLHDVWLVEMFQKLGLDMAEVRNPVTGADPYGPYYVKLVKVINRYILKKEFVEDVDVVKKDVDVVKEDVDVVKEDGISETDRQFGSDDDWVTTDSSKGTEEDSSSYEDAQEYQEVDDEGNLEEDSAEQTGVEADHYGHADAAIEG